MFWVLLPQLKKKIKSKDSLKKIKNSNINTSDRFCYIKISDIRQKTPEMVTEV